jgi:hypothetical protein
MSYAAKILKRALDGVESHGTVKAFLEDDEASAVARQMYIADYLSVSLGLYIYLAGDADRQKFGAMRDVHLTDGETAIVHCTAKPNVTYEDCACFLANAAGNQWTHIIIAHYTDSTVCPDLISLFSKGPFSYKCNRTNIEVFAAALVELSEAGFISNYREASASDEDEATFIPEVCLLLESDQPSECS